MTELWVEAGKATFRFREGTMSLGQRTYPIPPYLMDSWRELQRCRFVMNVYRVNAGNARRQERAQRGRGRHR